MKKEYDVVIVGAGNGGLTSACILAKNSKKVLLIDKNNIPGGDATSFTKGRFEFENLISNMSFLNNKKGEVYKLFKELNILDNIKLKDIPEAFRVISKLPEENTLKEDYTLPYGTNEFIKKMEEYVPGSTESLKTFFEIAKECSETLDYLNSLVHVNLDVLKEEHSTFVKYAPLSVSKVLNDLKMPLKAQQILSTYWIYCGAPIKTLNFGYFASMIYNLISKKGKVVEDGLYSISLDLENQFKLLGGDIKYNTKVTEIIVEDKKVKGIKCDNDEIIHCKQVICDINPHIVYSKMINKKNIPKQAIRLCNQRELGGRGFNIYLGLNKSLEEIGLDNYCYFLYQDLDSDKQYEKMKDLENDSSIVYCLNKANPTCSLKGTTMLYFNTLYFSDCFDLEVDDTNYFEMKERLAKKFINAFEEKLDIDITNNIEEIEIVTPVTYANNYDYLQGSIYGYQESKNDNLITRMFNLEKEEFIKGLKFCGSSSYLLHGILESYLSGIRIAKLTLEELEKESVK